MLVATPWNRQPSRSSRASWSPAWVRWRRTIIRIVTASCASLPMVIGSCRRLRRRCRSPVPHGGRVVARPSMRARTAAVVLAVTRTTRCGGGGVDEIAADTGRVGPEPQLQRSRTRRDRGDAFVEERPKARQRCRPAAGAQASTSPVSPHTPISGRQADLVGVVERRALLGCPVGVHERGVHVDRQQPRARSGAHRPRSGEHRAVHRRGLSDPTEIGAAEEPTQRRDRRQHLPPRSRRGGLIGEQGPVRHEVPARELDLHDRPVALAAAVAARPDRAQTTPSRTPIRPSRSSSGPHNATPATPVTESSPASTTTRGTPPHRSTACLQGRTRAR